MSACDALVCFRQDDTFLMMTVFLSITLCLFWVLQNTHLQPYLGYAPLLTSRQEQQEEKETDLEEKKKKKEVTARQMRLLTLMSMSASLLFSGFRGRPGRLGMLPLDISVVCSGGG